ncbi:O-antigen ligase family protein [Bacillus sp. UNC41MFS5]|uniref:O-antigen ligase family protein n=1 Tax=Bacillus sp. UNC41MFS5 TaxID=1449046 RepID=UPI00047BD97A|nr:O-antigen ligase family protein [Bacillus sp. UNC41MFS5]
MSYQHAQWEPIPSENVYTQAIAVTPLSRMLKIAGLLMLFLTFFFSVLKQGIKCSQGMFFSLFCMFAISTIWLVESLQYYGILTILVNVNTPPVILWYVIIGFLLGTDDRCWEVVKKLVPFIGIAFTLLSLVTAIEFNSQFTGARMAESSLLTYFMTGLWATAFWIFTAGKDKETMKSSLAKLFLVFILVIVALVTNSRGWLLQSSFLFLYTILSNQKKNKIAIIVSRVLVVVVILIGVNWLKDYFLTAYTNLVNRLSADTRSNQLSDFFSQVTISQMLFGQGVSARYYWNGRAYGFIDNQLLFVCFRYGIVPMAVFLMMNLRGIVIGWKKKKNEKYLLLMWLAALLGLSVYFNISMDLSNLIVMMLLGHLHKENILRRREVQPRMIKRTSVIGEV